MGNQAAMHTDGAVTTQASWGSDHQVAAGADLIQFIRFAIGDAQYGVDVMAVREIKGWSEITHLPQQPDYMRGVLNLRGIIVPIIDLRCRFGDGQTESTPLHVVIVVKIDRQIVGLLADRVLDIVSFDPSQIKPVPNAARGKQPNFLLGIVTVESAMIALIELSKLLPQPLAVPEEESPPSE